jgi:hypothetical protein
MIFCKELNKSFNNEEELFLELKANKEMIISEKKSQIQKSIDKGLSITAKPMDLSKFSVASKGISQDEGYFYLAVNSTNVLDSHKDLHVNGIWNKTVKEQQGKNYLVDSHVLSLKTTIVKREDIEMFTVVVPFSAIGKSYPGDTEILVYKFLKTKVIDKDALAWLESGDSIEASVRMRYTDIELAMNSESKEDETEKRNFDSYSPVIANKYDFEEEINYFWIVKQAQNLNESSLVLFGSNSSTGLVENDTKENKEIEVDPITSTKEIEPTNEVTQDNTIQLINNFKLN